MNALETALVCFDRTLYLKPDYVDAKSWVARVEAKKAGENFTATERAASTAAQVVKPSNISEITSSEETDSLLNMDSLNVSISVSESDASREITTPTTPVMPRRV
jgi:hypothetical protein